MPAIGAGKHRGITPRSLRCGRSIRPAAFNIAGTRGDDTLNFIDESEAGGSGRPADTTGGTIEFPAPLIPALYREFNPDLAGLDDDELLEHYREFGMGEGRLAGSIQSRADFAALIPANADTLELGPYFAPMLRGPNVRYFDVLSREQMIARAAAEGYEPAGIPDIDYVSPDSDLGIVDATFDFVASSHVIEHQPDLIRHFAGVERILRPGGCYFAVVPDKRYTFDHFIPESSLSHIIQAHFEGRTRHTLASLLEHRVLISHDDCGRHWEGDHGEYLEELSERTHAALAEYEAAGDAYIDVHAWYFTPESASAIFPALRELAYTNLELERVYATLRYTLEFYLIFRKPD